MISIVLPFGLLWTLCTASKYNDYYIQRNEAANGSRSTPPGIAAYRSALTLDWLAAEDSRQREMVAAIESEPAPVSARNYRMGCIDYARPPTGSIARLMLEMLKNLEGDNGKVITALIQALVRAKLLVLETSVFDTEPDLDTLVKTPSEMLGEPHITFPRIVSTVWMAVTDPSTVKRQGWCTVSKITAYLSATPPREIARRMEEVKQILARARFIMEEFILHVTPINMLQKISPLPTTKMPRANYPWWTARPASVAFDEANFPFKNTSMEQKMRLKYFRKGKFRRPVRTHRVRAMTTLSEPDTTPEPTATLPELYPEALNEKIKERIGITTEDPFSSCAAIHRLLYSLITLLLIFF